MIIAKLKEIREDAGLTQKQEAKKMKVAPSTISGWENGNDTIPLNRLIDFCNLYKVSLDYVFKMSSENVYSELEINIKKISAFLLNARKEYKLTQEQVANKLNISTGTYCDYENGNNLIKTTSLYSLTKIYSNLSFDIIFKKSHE